MEWLQLYLDSPPTIKLKKNTYEEALKLLDKFNLLDKKDELAKKSSLWRSEKT